MPHALFLSVGDSVKTAVAYDEVMPPEAPRTVLVDTFKDEVEESLRIAEALGDKLEAVRLDTPGERGGVTPALVRGSACPADYGRFSTCAHPRFRRLEPRAYSGAGCGGGGRVRCRQFHFAGRAHRHDDGY